MLIGTFSDCAQLVSNYFMPAGWSSLVARQAHNLKVAGSNPAPATNFFQHRAAAVALFVAWLADTVVPGQYGMAPAVGFEPTTNRLTADRSTTELRWITQSKMRVDIFAHDPLEATNNPRICLQKGAFGIAATIFKYNESVVFNISRVGCLRWQRSSWACPHGEERGEKHGDYR